MAINNKKGFWNFCSENPELVTIIVVVIFGFITITLDSIFGK